MLTSRTIATIAVVMLTSICAAAQTDPLREPPGQQQREPRVAKSNANETSATGSISGKVVNENGQPLANATVFVRAIGSTGQGRSVATDRQGAFQISDLEHVSYQVSASMAAYTVPTREPDSPPPPNYRVGDTVTLTLIKGGVVTGTVVNPAGEPIIAIGVRAQMIRDGNGRKVTSGPFIREVPTDDRGVYRIYGLPSGTYLVIAGSSRDFSRTGINPFEDEVPTYAPSSTRDTAAEIAVRAGEEMTNVDIRYRAEQGRTISGIASGPIGPESGFSISLTPAGDAPTQSNSTYQFPELRGFVFHGVADGDYQIMAQSSMPGGERFLSEPKLIKVRGADISGIEVTTRPLGSVSGRVVLEESKAPECTDKQRPLFNETVVSAWHNENEAAKSQPSFIWSVGAPAPPDADGNVLLRNLAPGQYYFVARVTTKYWYLQSIAFAPTATTAGVKTAKPIDAMHVWTNIKAGDRLTGLTITVAEGAASLRGQLALGEGEQQPPRLYVYLVPAERERADDLLRFFAAPVSPDGKISLHNIAPGRYWILAQPFSEDVPTPLTKLRLPHETETRAKLRREAEAAKNEIEFKPCQNVADFKLSLKP